MSFKLSFSALTVSPLPGLAQLFLDFRSIRFIITPPTTSWPCGTSRWTVGLIFVHSNHRFSMFPLAQFPRNRSKCLVGFLRPPFVVFSTLLASFRWFLFLSSLYSSLLVALYSLLLVSTTSRIFGSWTLLLRALVSASFSAPFSRWFYHSRWDLRTRTRGARVTKAWGRCRFRPFLLGFGFQWNIVSS